MSLRVLEQQTWGILKSAESAHFGMRARRSMIGALKKRKQNSLNQYRVLEVRSSIQKLYAMCAKRGAYARMNITKTVENRSIRWPHVALRIVLEQTSVKKESVTEAQCNGLHHNHQ